MSQVMESIDIRTCLSSWLNGLQHMYLADIRAIPDDKLTVSPGGVARPANELTADTISLLDWTTEALKGNVIDEYGPNAMATLSAKLTSKEAIGEAFSKAVERFNSALQSASNESLARTITPPWKMDAPMWMLAQIAVSHVWYHDGQLNYIQALNGDGEVHWMG